MAIVGVTLPLLERLDRGNSPLSLRVVGVVSSLLEVIFSWLLVWSGVSLLQSFMVILQSAGSEGSFWGAPADDGLKHKFIITWSVDPKSHLDFGTSMNRICCSRLRKELCDSVGYNVTRNSQKQNRFSFSNRNQDHKFLIVQMHTRQSHINRPNPYATHCLCCSSVIFAIKLCKH